MTRWSELQEPFRHIAFRDGIKKTADRVPAGRDTIYRLIKGETQQPSKAIQASIERIVREDTEGKP